MKRIVFLASVIVSVMAVCAESAIENVIVRQRWPWSKVVDIDFVVTGEATGVKFTAKYDGAEEFVLAEKDLSGKARSAEMFEPGVHHLEWNPASAGLGEVELKNFIVKAEPDDKTYLILNLNDGSYRYAAAEPEGGWLADPANYQTNIVFRRIPKGTKKLGLTDALSEKVGVYFNYEKEHSATLTSDYYISVYMVTKGQQEYINAKGKGETLSEFTTPRIFGTRKYDELRGSTNEIAGINWPRTKHDVAHGTVISNVREIVKNTFSTEWIVDIPSSVQWEYAAKGTNSFDQLLSVGGKADDENFYENYTNLLDNVAIWSHNYVSGEDKIVGQKAKNGYGLYDVIGLGSEWVADLYKNQIVNYSGTNPVGPDEGTGGYRLLRSVGCGVEKLNCYTTAYATYKKQDNNSYGYRLCINLKSLFKDE